MSNTFGRLFRITTWGESHGHSIGVVVDGCPPRLALDAASIQRELDRRKPGQSRITTQRREDDRVAILSGVYLGLTLGTPIALMVENADARGKDYSEMRDKYRPSHADYTYQAKYGIRAVEGGGRASARETVGRVAGGAVARLVLAQAGIEVLAWVDRVADISARVDRERVSLGEVESNIARCPDPDAAERMIDRIDAARKDGNSLGGVVRAIARGVPPGLGEPVFDKLEADLARAMVSLPAAKGFEVGSGFGGVAMTGAEHNDLFYMERQAGDGTGGAPAWVTAQAARDPHYPGRVRTRSNYSGGIQGGISNGEDIEIAVAFKPTATILRPQPTVDQRGEEVVLEPRGRHDPCVLPRAVPIVEAMMALVLADHLLRLRAQCGADFALPGR